MSASNAEGANHFIGSGALEFRYSILTGCPSYDNDLGIELPGRKGDKNILCIASCGGN